MSLASLARGSERFAAPSASCSARRSCLPPAQLRQKSKPTQPQGRRAWVGSRFTFRLAPVAAIEEAWPISTVSSLTSSPTLTTGAASRPPWSSDISTRTPSTGAPTLDDTLANFDCRVIKVFDESTHHAFLCEVLATRERNDGEALIYLNGGFRRIAQ